MGTLTEVFGELFLLMGLGYFFKKQGLFSAQTIQEMSSFCVNITCPLLVIDSVERMKATDASFVYSWLFLGIGLYLFLPFFAYAAVRLLNVQVDERHLWEFMFIFSNTSLLGFPVVQSLFGDTAVFYTAILHLPFDVLVYSYGVWLMCGKSDFSLKNLCNSGLMLTIMALFLYAGQWHLPKILVGFCSLAGNMTTPLSMLILGASLAKMKLYNIFIDVRLWAMSLIRLMAIPAGVYFLLQGIGGFDSFYTGIAVITFGMPVGSMIVMMAAEYQNQEELATRSVAMTTVCLFFTLPVLIKLMEV